MCLSCSERLELDEVLGIVRAVEGAKKRKSDDLKYVSFYSLYVSWVYKGVPSVEPGHEQCPFCKGFDGGTFAGSVLRSTFPDHEVFGEDIIYVNYHKTLWGKDTCKCYLYRMGSAEDPDVDFPFNDGAKT